MTGSEDPLNYGSRSSHQAVIDHLDREWIASLTLDLARIPSVTMDEARICSRFAEAMEDCGLCVDVREVTPGRNNLYARIRGAGTGPALVFNGHLDTIPIGSCPAPHRAGGSIYGRGTTDMKGGMAAMLGAARALVRSGVQLAGDVWFTAVVGHEEVEAQKDGPMALIDDLNSGRLAGDRIIIVEGRDALWIMSMGSMVFTINLDSDKGGMHTQYVPFGDNPVRSVGAVIDRVNRLQEQLDRSTVHPLAGPEKVDIGQVHAGDYFNRTAVHCELSGTRRWCPGRSAPEVRGELESIMAPIAEAGNLRLTVEMDHNREPFETDPDDPAVQAVASAHEEITGRGAEYVGMRIVGDGNLYANGTGIPTFYYGPSNETAHADLEWVDEDRLESAAKVYALAAVRYSGVPHD